MVGTDRFQFWKLCYGRSLSQPSTEPENNGESIKNRWTFKLNWRMNTMRSIHLEWKMLTQNLVVNRNCEMHYRCQLQNPRMSLCNPFRWKERHILNGIWIQWACGKSQWVPFNWICDVFIRWWTIKSKLTGLSLGWPMLGIEQLRQHHDNRHIHTEPNSQLHRRRNHRFHRMFVDTVIKHPDHAPMTPIKHKRIDLIKFFVSMAPFSFCPKMIFIFAANRLSEQPLMKCKRELIFKLISNDKT